MGFFSVLCSVLKIVVFLLVFIFSVLPFTDSFGIFKLFLMHIIDVVLCSVSIKKRRTSQDSELSFFCMLNVSILLLSTIFQLTFGTVPNVW